MRTTPGQGRDLLSDPDPGREPSHDLVLGMPALFGIFVAVALICAVCFGFGYSSSRSFHAPQPQSAIAGPASQAESVRPAPPSEPEAAPTPQESAAEEAYPTSAPAPEKPEPGTTVASPETPPEQARRAPAAASTQSTSVQAQPQDSANATFARGASPATPQAATSTPQAMQAAPRTAPPAAEADSPAASAVPAPIGSGMMVQIAAVTRAADAQTLANALRHDGFDAIVRTSTGDPYFHVQIGPFASAQAAKAMRTRLADSGYNAFIKP